MHFKHSVCGYEHSAEQNNPVNCFARGLIRVDFKPCLFNANFYKNNVKILYNQKIILILCTKSKPYKKTEFLHLKHLKEFVE